jgi:hypothetical protein
MKTRLLPTLLLIILLLSACHTEKALQAQVHLSVYTKIPLAPNVVLTVGAPVIVAPSPDHIWIDGYWTWDNRYREYVWVQGYWALAPYQDAYWLPGYWEYYGNGYRWVDAYWTPRDFRLNFGYYDGRYDYYGRPVYYPPQSDSRRRGYAYGYDHNPDHRGKRYNSSTYFNESSRKEQERINREYKSARSDSNASSRQPASRNTGSNNRSEREQSSVTEQRSTSGDANRRTSTVNAGNARTDSNASSRQAADRNTDNNNRSEKEQSSATEQRSTSGDANRRTSTVNAGNARTETKQETIRSTRESKQENSTNTTRSSSKSRSDGSTQR